MKKRAIQILLVLSLIFTNQLGFGGFSIISQSPIYQQVVNFSDSAFDGEWSSFISGHLSTSFCRKENFSFQVAAEVFYLPFIGLHHFVYV